MPSKRDPVSITYDEDVTRLLMRAIRGHQQDRDQPRVARMFVRSPIRQFKELDHGGLTANERGAKRALYYRTWRVPSNAGVTPQWAPVVTWGPLENRSGRWGRE